MNPFSFLINQPFYEFSLILLLAAILGAFGQLLRQPLIIMFIVLGILVGPSVLDIVKSKENIDLLAKIGISILLFIVGLKLDLRIIRSVGKIAILTGLGQVVFTSLIGYFIGLGLGFSSLHSFYIAVALTFSSTIIIVKLLSDKKEIDTLHGQIAVGFLIVQDMVVILAMVVLSTIGKQNGSTVFQDILQTVLSGGILVFITWLAMTRIIPKLSYFLAKSQEMLTLFAIAWSLTLATIGELLGFSGEVGAFLAGVSLASSVFKDMISSRLTSLRDFLLIFFFVNLGANLNLFNLGNQVPSALIFSAFVLIGNPIIVLIIMGYMGYSKRTSFLAGLTVAQISEFSLIFANLGLAVGHLNEDIIGLITFVGLVTIGLSTYLILYSHQIYELLAPALSIFERKTTYREQMHTVNPDKETDLIIFGLGRFGSRIAEMADEHENIHYLGIDFDPKVVKKWLRKGKPVMYGDAEDADILDGMPLKKAKCIVITIPEAEQSVKLIKHLKERGYTGKLFATMRSQTDLELLTDINPDEILLPYQMAATNFYNYYLKKLL